MAGQIVVSSIKTDSDNSISFLANTGATIFSANLASGLAPSSFGDNTIASDKIVSVANTKLTGTITATQMAANSVNSTILQTNSIENYMATSGRSLSNRNLIINGAMQIAQRNTSVTGITTSDYYTADRWQFQLTSAGTWTMNVESSGPANTEFRSSANLICTTADSSLSASDRNIFRQLIEGQNLQGIKKGTSAAESLTVSFWVKSSNTGTYICEFYDNDNTRQISKSYTIDTANTWEKKTITVPPDTTGQFDNDNGTSLQLNFWLASGTTYTSGTLNDTAWASSTNANRAVGQLNLANEVGNYWAVTGVQLEPGAVATPFEMRSFGQELALCQRYYQKSYDYETVPGTSTVIGSVTTRNDAADTMTNHALGTRFVVTMRTIPTMTFYSRSGTSGSVSNLGASLGSETSTATVSSVNGLGTNGVSWILVSPTSGPGISMQYTVDAEL